MMAPCPLCSRVTTEDIRRMCHVCRGAGEIPTLLSSKTVGGRARGYGSRHHPPSRARAPYVSFAGEGAREVVEYVRREVLHHEPRAVVHATSYRDEGTSFLVEAWVDADEVAAIDGGPAHRECLAVLAYVMRRAVDAAYDAGEAIERAEREARR